MLLPLKGKDGSITYMNIGRIMPQSIQLNSVNMLINLYDDPNYSITDGIASSVLNSVAPFIEGDMFVQTFSAISSNKHPFTGKEIYLENSTPFDKNLDIMNFVWSNTLRPGAIKTYQDFSMAAHNYEDKYGRKHDVPTFVANQFGGRIENYDIKQRVKTNLYSTQSELDASDASAKEEYKQTWEDQRKELNMGNNKQEVDKKYDEIRKRIITDWSERTRFSLQAANNTIELTYEQLGVNTKSMVTDMRLNNVYEIAIKNKAYLDKLNYDALFQAVIKPETPAWAKKK